MTVCIGAYCSREKAWVGVADRLLSVGDMAHDSLFKMNAIGQHWLVMFSGNDISPVSNVLSTIASKVESEASDSLAVLTDAFRAAYQVEIARVIETDLLARFQMDLLEFKRNGNSYFGPEIFGRMVYQIQETNIDLTFLVVGFDGNRPRIFRVDSPGKITFYDSAGFWAIGCGETAALSVLFGCKSLVIYKSLPEVIAKVVHAKFTAEQVPGVGKQTNMFVLYQNTDRALFNEDDLSPLREAWQTSVIPDVPVAAHRVAAEILSNQKMIGNADESTESDESIPSTPETSEDQP